mgnify:FL=1
MWVMTFHSWNDKITSIQIATATMLHFAACMLSNVKVTVPQDWRKYRPWERLISNKKSLFGELRTFNWGVLVPLVYVEKVSENNCGIHRDNAIQDLVSYIMSQTYIYTISSKRFKVKLNKSKVHWDVGVLYTNFTKSNLPMLHQQQYLSFWMSFDSEMFGAFCIIYGCDVKLNSEKR